MAKKILIISGEPSGDLHAGNLAQKILEIDPQIKISAVGGTALRRAGAEIIYDIKGLSVMGLFDVLAKLPKFLALKKFLLKKIKEDKPDAIIFVDFSGFNLRFAKALNRTIPAIYYISPQVWASRQGRVKTIKKYISKVIVLFKFEEEFYKKYGISADLAGHPLLDIVQPTMRKQDTLIKYDLSESKTILALLPGSRKNEIKNILPIMLKAAVLIQKALPDTQFVIAKSEQVDPDVYRQITRGIDLNLKIIDAKTYDCLNIAEFCLVCSGTATLETAIMQKPFVVIYKMGLLNYLLYRPQVRVPYIGMVNIVTGKKVVEEFIQFNTSAKKISDTVLKILQSPSEITRIKDSLAQVKSSLGEKGASLRAAQIAVNFLQ